LNSLLLIRETRTFSGVRVRQESEFRIQESGELEHWGAGVLGYWGVGVLGNLVCAKLVIWRKEGDLVQETLLGCWRRTFAEEFRSKI
jgi:hypothetical protein